jgi:hypothetical protein
MATYRFFKDGIDYRYGNIGSIANCLNPKRKLQYISVNIFIFEELSVRIASLISTS